MDVMYLLGSITRESMEYQLLQNIYVLSFDYEKKKFRFFIRKWNFDEFLVTNDSL